MKEVIFCLANYMLPQQRGLHVGFFNRDFLRINRNRRKAVLTGLLRGDFVFGEVVARGGGVLPYKGLMGRCGQPGYVQYVFRDFCLKQGIEFIIFCLNQGIDLSIFVLNRISFLGR